MIIPVIKIVDHTEAIGLGGVYHGDMAFRNLMWHSLNKEIRVVDFERSKAKKEEWVRDHASRQALGWEYPSFQEQNFIDLRNVHPCVPENPPCRKN